MFSSSLSVALAIALLAPSAVNAHGYVQEVATGGKSYSGFLPFTDPYEQPPVQRIVRKITDDGPIFNLNSPDMACNKGGENGAALVATAAAGSKVTVTWGDGTAPFAKDHYGPYSVFMASCGDDCKGFKASKARWFKVEAVAYNAKTQKWGSQLVFENNGQWTTTIPSNIKAGEYLMRHEILALHSAGQPQAYPSCLQLKVTGGGDKVPSGSELVNIPGLYSGVQLPDIWQSGESAKFVYPGPHSITATPSSGDSKNDEPSPEEPSTVSPPSYKPSSTSTQKPASTPNVTSIPDKALSDPNSNESHADTPSKGKCPTKRRRRTMVKRRVSHFAHRHH